MSTDNEIWSGLSAPRWFRPILTGCLDRERRLYASDSFALLVGVWELSGAAFSGVFPSIHQRGDAQEPLHSHLQFLARDSQNLRGLSRGNLWVARHVAQLACAVLGSGGVLSERADWDDAFRGHRHQMVQNYPGGPDWAQRQPGDARGQNPTRAAVSELAQQGVAHWEDNGLNSKAWVKAWIMA